MKSARRNRKREREKEPRQEAEPGPYDGLWESYGNKVPFWKFAASRDARSIIYDAKLGPIWDKPLAVAKYLAEELRANLPHGVDLLGREVELHWKEKGFVPKMLLALSTYVKDEQPMFDKMDYKIAEIVQQHPYYTIKEITFAVSKQYPERKWTERKLKTLARRVQRLVKNGPLIGEQFKKLMAALRS
jgi:hypothetical protein